MPENDQLNVTMTRADFEAWQKLRLAHAVPEVIGQPMSFVEEDRKFGESWPVNPPNVTRIKSPGDWVDKQLQAVQQVGEANYRKGIANPKRDWQQAAINGQAAYENKMRDNAVLKRREDSIRKVSSDEWATQAERGASRLVQGTLDRRPKIERKVQALHGLMTSHLGRIDQMPSATPAEREQRMVMNLRGMRDMKGKV